MRGGRGRSGVQGWVVVIRKTDPTKSPTETGVLFWVPQGTECVEGRLTGPRPPSLNECNRHDPFTSQNPLGFPNKWPVPLQSTCEGLCAVSGVTTPGRRRTDSYYYPRGDGSVVPGVIRDGKSRGESYEVCLQQEIDRAHYLSHDRFRTGGTEDG